MKILVLDDEPDDLEIIRDLLRLEFKDHRIDARPYNPAEIINYMSYDVIVLDELLGTARGTELAVLMRRLAYRGIILLISGASKPRANIDGFLHKRELGRLADRLRELLEAERDD